MAVKEVQREKLKEYNIYAGLSGAFEYGYQYTSLFESQEDADMEAWELSKSIYEEYEGYHGLMSYDEALEEAGSQGCTGDETIAVADEIYAAAVEEWIEYKAVLTSEDTETPEDELVRDYIIEDGDGISETSSEGV